MKTELTLNALQSMNAQEYEDILMMSATFSPPAVLFTRMKPILN